MIRFNASAPGKVILCGEHAVVYGKTAVAASLDLHTVIKFTETSEQIIEISFSKVGLFSSFPLKKIQDFFFGDSFEYRSGDHDLLYNQVQQFVATTKCATSQQKLCLEVFLYSVVCICYEEKIKLKSFRIHLNTELSLASGLGSSASFAVCLAACFFHWSRLQKRSLSDTSCTNNFDATELEKISTYAFNCEKICHGNPSGIDNSICTYGSIIEFRKGEPMNPISGVPQLEILLVNSKFERSTKMQVQKLAELKREYPAIVDPVLNSIDAISREVLQVIDKIDKLSDAIPIEEYKQLKTLIDMNQGLLYMLKVSHWSLDKICTEAHKRELAAKLTGAGGGGYAFILLPPTADYRNELIENISESLIKLGFSVMRTSLGGGGVKICDFV